MPTKYFAGNSLASLFRSSTSVVESTIAGRFDSANVSNSVVCGNMTSDFVQTPAFSATGVIWVRWDAYEASTYHNGGTLILLRNGVTDVFRIISTGAGAPFQAQYWNGSAWVATGATFTGSNNTLYTYALKVTLGSGFEFYRNGTLMTSGSGWSGGGTAVTNLRLASGNGTAAVGHYISQVMIADYDIRDSKFATSALNGVSASNADGSGAVSAINETVLDDSTAAFLTVSGNKRGFTHAGITVPGGYIIAAAVISARGRATGIVPDGKLGIRSAGTNYSGSGLGYNGGYEPRQRIIETDPATATQFTQAGFNAAEPFLEAA